MSDTVPVTPAADQPPADPPAPVTAPVSDRGFPDGVSVTDMTDAQQAAYYKFHSRKHESTVKAYGGVTPKQVTEMQARIKALEIEQLTESEKAIEAAKAEAADAARVAAEADWRPRLQAAELKALASTILDKDQLKSFMEYADLSKFAAPDGAIDEDKVMGHLTAVYGQPRQFGAGLPQHMNWGQHSTPPPAGLPGAGGRAEAARRRGEKPT